MSSRTEENLPPPFHFEAGTDETSAGLGAAVVAEGLAFAATAGAPAGMNGGTEGTGAAGVALTTASGLGGFACEMGAGAAASLVGATDGATALTTGMTACGITCGVG